MGTIDTHELPPFDGNTDVLAAKAWFAALTQRSGTFHADDPLAGLEDDAGGPAFTDGAAAEAQGIVERFRAASSDWPDPDVIYDFAGNGPFPVEAAYPDLVVDCVVPAASRTGWVALPGQSAPTIVVEDGGRFVAVRVVPGRGRLSEATGFEVMPVVGAEFDPQGGIDVTGAEIVDSEMEFVDDRSGLEGAIERVVDRTTAPPPP